MKAVYREVLADLDERIERLRGTREAIARIADADDNAVVDRSRRHARGRQRVGRAKVGGGDQVVLDVVTRGACTLKTIAAAAKVKPWTAAAALRRLIDAKRIRREGATSTLRYLAK